MKKIYIASRCDLKKSYLNLPIYNLFTNYDDLIPIVLPFILDETKLEFILQNAAGLIIPGGIDINPKLYKQENSNSNYLEILDQYDFLLLKIALKNKIPTFGICRGIQVINVYFNGSLFQNILNHDNLLHSITFNNQKYLVNSYHHQAINKLGDNLKILVESDDKTIEAIAAKYYPLIAVQWHPELEMNKKINKHFWTMFINLLR